MGCVKNTKTRKQGNGPFFQLQLQVNGMNGYIFLPNGCYISMVIQEGKPFAFISHSIWVTCLTVRPPSLTEVSSQRFTKMNSHA